jgi:hypothetical protein
MKERLRALLDVVIEFQARRSARLPRALTW